MPTFGNVADFIIVADEYVYVKPEAAQTLTFNIDKFVRTGDRGILQFALSTNAAQGLPNELTVTLTLNGKNIRAVANITGQYQRSIHVVIPGSLLAGGTNKLVLEAIAGTGSIGVGNIVVWVQTQSGY